MYPPSKSTLPPPVVPGAGATVDQWLAYLEAIHPSEIDLGLDRVLVVLRRLFPAKPKARIITVAGTNGKGSAVATLEKLLMAAGRTTGAYTSPHLERYNERVRLQGTDISDASLVSAFEQVEAARGKTSLTYFEFGTLAAFVAFSEAGVQDWVLEVGLGGRLDAVNVLDADLAVITSVDIDHVAFLGDNREVIGFEKAGVLRPGIAAVYADGDPPKSVLQQVAAQRVSLALAGRDYSVTELDSMQPGTAAAMLLEYQNRQIRLPVGPLPVPSVAAAVVAMHRLQPELSNAIIEQTLAELRVPGRFEQLGEQPRIIADVGHNPHAAAWLAGRLATLKSSGVRIHGVYGALADKDIDGVMRAMKPVVDTWWLAGLQVPRGLSVEQLLLRAKGLDLDVADCLDTVAQAVDAVLASAGADDVVVVFGSFYTVAAARALLLQSAS